MAGEEHGFLKKENEPKLFLRPSSIVTIVFLTITAIALAYIAGVMSGRHGGSAREKSIQITTPAAEVKAEGVEREKILAPEELNFARELRGQPARIPPKTERDAPESGIMEAESQSADNGEDGPEASEKAATSRANAGLFDYLFQMAAFRDENSADNLRQKLEGEGYRTILQKNGKLLVVLVRIRGPESSETELRKFALSLKLGEPLLKNKHAVPQ